MSQIGWFPRYSPDNDRLTWERPNHWQAQWVNGTTEIAHNGVNILIGGVPTSAIAPNELSAGGDRWAGFRPDPVHVYTSWDLTLLGAGCPTINPDGLFGYVDDRQAAMKNLIFDNRHVSHGAITDVRASRQALVWSAAGKTWGMRLDVPDAASYIQAAPVEFRPIPIDTPDGPWVGNHTHAGLVLRPFAETQGYRFDNGEQAFGADWKYRAGSIVAIFTNDAGVQSTQTFDLRAARVELGSTEPPPPVPPQPPTPEPPPMADLNLSADVRAERAKYPAVLTEDQPAKILNAVAWAHRADGWGLSVKPRGNHVPSPQGVFVAYDILHHKPTNKLFGCFTNELRADVNWGEEIYHGDPVGRPWLAPVDPGTSVPAPPPPPTTGHELTNDEVRAIIAEINRFYMEPDGLNRAARGRAVPIVVDDPATWDWVALGLIKGVEEVKRRIRTFPEWKEQHP